MHFQGTGNSQFSCEVTSRPPFYGYIDECIFHFRQCFFFDSCQFLLVMMFYISIFVWFSFKFCTPVRTEDNYKLLSDSGRYHFFPPAAVVC